MSTQYERKIILVGKTGNGKSSLGNVLLGRRAFTEALSFSAVTKKCQLERKEENASVVDTPGLFDSDECTSLVKNALEIQQAVQQCPNPHAFLIVLNGMTRLTEEELLTIDVLRIIFGEQCLKKAVIVLTHIENNMDQRVLRRMLEGCSKINDLIEQCGGRYARIDNSEPRPEHKEYIIQLVDNVSKSGTDCFENDCIDVHKQVLLEKSLTSLDSKPVHDQIKHLSERICYVIEEQQRERRSKKIKIAIVSGVACSALVLCLYRGESVAAIVNAVCEENPEAVVKSLRLVTQNLLNVAISNPKAVERSLIFVTQSLLKASISNPQTLERSLTLVIRSLLNAASSDYSAVSS